MKLTVDRVIVIFGLILTILGFGLEDKYVIIIGSLVLVIAIVIIILGFDNLLEKYREAFEYRKITYEYSLLDKSGELADIKVSHFLKVKRRMISIGDNSFDSYPYNLKTYIVHSNQKNIPPDNKIELQHASPKKIGAYYEWAVYYDPPIRKGQTFWQIDTFKIKGAFRENTETNCFQSLRKIKEFRWIVRFPESRPCKRWWVSANYLRWRPDNLVLKESLELTSTLDFELKNLQKGALYYLHWQW